MKTKSTRNYRIILALALGALVPTATTLRADDRDDKIEDAYKNTYIYRTQLRDSDISISSKNGTVTLKGTVDSVDQKRLAEDTAQGLPGVTRVDDMIKVRNEPKESSDDWIAMKVRGALLFHRNVSITDTKVTVRNGVATLTGLADNEAEKALAAEYAADVKGVEKVDNRIEVGTRRSDAISSDSANHKGSTSERSVGEKIDDASITAQLKYALGVRRSTSALKTEITTREGVVTVTGEAQNGAEKDLVTQLAKNIGGVREVHNEMSVRQ
jgi:osmotically-inducible protein OsmY